MTNSPRSAKKHQSWITGHRIVVLVFLVAIAAGVGYLAFKPSAPVTTIQASKVEQGGSFLESAGFNDPTYLGVTDGMEGKYPTYRVTTINGEPIDVWIRTAPNGGWEIQPIMLFQTVKSADDLARVAQQAVMDWENVSAQGIEPRTDGSYGEYESREYQYGLLSKYVPDDSYWVGVDDETIGWPQK